MAQHLFFINGGAKIIPGEKDWPKEKILNELKRAFPSDFDDNCDITDFQPGLANYTVSHTSSPSTPSSAPHEGAGGFNCDLCDEPIFDDIRFHNLETGEDACPDCHVGGEEEEGAGWVKESARPFIPDDFKRQFYLSSASSSTPPLPLDSAFVILNESHILKQLRCLISFLNRDCNVQSVTGFLKDSERGFLFKKAKPMLCDEKATQKLIDKIILGFKKLFRGESEAFTREFGTFKKIKK